MAITKEVRAVVSIQQAVQMTGTDSVHLAVPGGDASAILLSQCDSVRCATSQSQAATPTAGDCGEAGHAEGRCGNLHCLQKALTERDAQWAQVAPLADNERAELLRLRALINTPQTADWTHAVDMEAAHQQERWGSDHDAGKAPEDWFWLLGYLGGKALHAFKAGNHDKGLHHIVSTSAALLNWHRSVTGQNTRMRPGIDPVARQVTPSPQAHAVPTVSPGGEGARPNEQEHSPEAPQ